MPNPLPPPSIFHSLVIRVWILVTCFLLFPGLAQGTHFAAGDLRVTYAGAGVDPCNGKPDYTYKIELHVYGACEDRLPIGISQMVYYQSENSGLPVENVSMDCISHVDGSVVAPGSGYLGQNVHSLCPIFDHMNSCRNINNGHLPGFYKWVYTKTITLPSAQTDWKFWFRGNARNAGIVNLQNPQGSFYVEAGINNFAKFNTNTPIFDAFPLPYICA